MLNFAAGGAAREGHVAAVSIVLVGEPAPGRGGLDDFEPIEPASPVRLSDLVNEDRG
jgi:hypothetical protein